jgi:hypothetical protein
MDNATREQLCDEFYIETKKLRTTKGVEYANNKDCNHNFKIIGEKLGIDPKIVLWIYASKHFQSIESYLKTGATLTEPIEGRIADAINYLFILNSMIEEQKKENTNFIPTNPIHDKNSTLKFKHNYIAD